MRNAHWISYFRRAVLLTLTLPACGGEALVKSTSDGGVPHPDTPCSWTTGVGTSCSWSFSFTGDPTSCAGFIGSGSAAQCVAVCATSSTGQTPDSCFVAEADGGPGSLSCTSSTGTCKPGIPPGNGGRRPGYFASLGFGPAAPGRELGVHFARVACMEAGSVEAFRWLRDELVAHGAPKRLVRAAERAIRDEVRHVRQTSALARRFGEQPIAPLPTPPRVVRPLVEVALENAVEGCIRETYSALECAWQAESAEDPVVRATMKRIAQDEMRHLALSWAVQGWALGKLDRASRRRVLVAQRAEVRALQGELAVDPPVSLVRTAGLPRAFQSRALVSAIAAKLAA